MPEYAPVLLPGLTGTFIAAVDVTGGEPVEVVGSGTVAKCTPGPSGLGSAKYVGIAAQDVTAGLHLTVILDNTVHEGAADGAINAGDQLMASAKIGRQVAAVPAAASTPGQADIYAARAVIGLALTTAADGGTVRWLQK
jgi:hypothetical protein